LLKTLKKEKPTCEKLSKPIGDVCVGQCIRLCGGSERIRKCLDSQIEYEKRVEGFQGCQGVDY